MEAPCWKSNQLATTTESGRNGEEARRQLRFRSIRQVAILLICPVDLSSAGAYRFAARCLVSLSNILNPLVTIICKLLLLYSSELRAMQPKRLRDFSHSA